MTEDKSEGAIARPLTEEAGRKDSEGGSCEPRSPELCPVCDRKLKPKVHFVEMEDSAGIKHRTKQTIVKCRCGLSSNLIQGLP